jgi:carbonic anhydrase
VTSPRARSSGAAAMRPEEPPTAIVACMDARLDAAGFLALWPQAVHVVRNAGGRASDDALRSLAASCAMGTERVVVVHHTDCAMAKHSDEQIRALLPEGAPAGVEFLTIADPEAALREDVETVRSSPLLPEGIDVRGFVYDLEAGAPREVVGS